MSIDHATFAALERRLKDLEHWVLVVLCPNLGAVQDQVLDLKARYDQAPSRHEIRIDSQWQAIASLQDQVVDLEERLARVDHDIIADKQPAPELDDPFELVSSPIRYKQIVAEEPAQPRCCICADSPETAFRQPLPCHDCGRHPQPASGPSDYAIQKAAGVWCRPELGHKVMDVELATGFARVIDEINQPKDAGQWGTVEEEPAEEPIMGKLERLHDAPILLSPEDFAQYEAVVKHRRGIVDGDSYEPIHYEFKGRRVEKDDGGGSRVPTSLATAKEPSLDVAAGLLMRVVPILDLHVSQHNDGRRLRSAICDFLADRGYPGWREARCPAEEPLLGLATTQQLIEEVMARVEVAGLAAYRTVGA